jgi:hypothetical protein
MCRMKNKIFFILFMITIPFRAFAVIPVTFFLFHTSDKTVNGPIHSILTESLRQDASVIIVDKSLLASYFKQKKIPSIKTKHGVQDNIEDKNEDNDDEEVLTLKAEIKNLLTNKYIVVTDSSGYLLAIIHKSLLAKGGNPFADSDLRINQDFQCGHDCLMGHTPSIKCMAMGCDFAHGLKNDQRLSVYTHMASKVFQVVPLLRNQPIFLAGHGGIKSTQCGLLDDHYTGLLDHLAKLNGDKNIFVLSCFPRNLEQQVSLRNGSKRFIRFGEARELVTCESNQFASLEDDLYTLMATSSLRPRELEVNKHNFFVLHSTSEAQVYEDGDHHVMKKGIEALQDWSPSHIKTTSSPTDEEWPSGDSDSADWGDMDDIRGWK